ncbi:MAG TPA: hypothetical protein DEQ09_11415, partial [Bacteroidales bacterium]|nr:hypothetical protein [Bacteroidales bacterium]
MGVPDWQDEYLGLPGDNLNLYAVMKLFQESETLEAFERNLNGEDSRINNLDLNGDNMVDYITVSDFVDGDVHNITLRVFLNQHESQDVAVFIVEQLRNGEVQIQLIGDEALYGKNYIIEPNYAETPNPGYTGSSGISVVRYNYYDIAGWPVIRYIYHPAYVVWRSSWYWDYYPVYWNPWRTHYWHFYYGYHYNWYTYYHRHYRPWKHIRYSGYNNFYCNRVRVYSPTVTVNINRGVYRNTYSRPDRRRAGEQLYARTHTRSVNRNTARSATSRNSTVTRRTTVKAPANRNAANRSTQVRSSGRSITSRQASKVQNSRSSAGSRSAVSSRSSASKPAAKVQSRTSPASSRSAV